MFTMLWFACTNISLALISVSHLTDFRSIMTFLVVMVIVILRIPTESCWALPPIIVNMILCGKRAILVSKKSRIIVMHFIVPVV